MDRPLGTPHPSAAAVAGGAVPQVASHKPQVSDAVPQVSSPKSQVSSSYALLWQDVSLLDRSDSALADWREEITRARRWETAKDLWANGVISQLEAAQVLYPTLRQPVREMAEPVPAPDTGAGRLTPMPTVREEM